MKILETHDDGLPGTLVVAGLTFVRKEPDSMTTHTDELHGVEETTGASAPSVPTASGAGGNSPVLAADLQQWRTSGAYLPEFMRDFHDQKGLFKALQDVVARSNAKHGVVHRSLNASWAEYHVYTVDIFLWVMAGHGYTLQRSRRKFGFASIYDFVSRARDEAHKAMSSVLKSAFSTGDA